MANTGTPLLQELARAADSDDIGDQLLVLFSREVAEDTEKMENYRQLSGQLRNGVRMRDRYIRELRTSDMSDEVAESIEILKRVQLDMEKESRLLLMAREIQKFYGELFSFQNKRKVGIIVNEWNLVDKHFLYYS
uniref:Uncharacterized protein n=1 Tax=Tanacetum cinerariifolium TaxID=118510 RepID=A0A699GH13_TANCI|nr:hypothetical protein [Tanacetum cinerariifolium]